MLPPQLGTRTLATGPPVVEELPVIDRVDGGAGSLVDHTARPDRAYARDREHRQRPRQRSGCLPTGAASSRLVRLSLGSLLFFELTRFRHPSQRLSLGTGRRSARNGFEIACAHGQRTPDGSVLPRLWSSLPGTGGCCQGGAGNAPFVRGVWCVGGRVQCPGERNDRSALTDHLEDEAIGEKKAPRRAQAGRRPAPCLRALDEAVTAG